MTAVPPATAPHRQPVPTLLTLANVGRPRRPAGARVHSPAGPPHELDEAVSLLAPLELHIDITRADLPDLAALAGEVHAVADALVQARPVPSVGTINRLAQQEHATRRLVPRPDGTVTPHLDWHRASAVAELANRVIAELGHLEPNRLRQCARAACTLLFYDTTRSNTQRWHSESPCGLRERQDRHRATARG